MNTKKTKLKGNSPSPAAADLFRRGPGGLLCEKQKEIFHTCTAKGIFIAKRSRPDIALAISVLSGRVRDPTKDDWKKLKRLCDYLEGSFKLHLVLKIDADGVPILKWYVDASFAVHEDFRSHTGGVLKASQQGGALISGSIRQKLNTRSSTEAELVGADNFMSKIV